MKMTLRLGRVAGIPIRANWSALLTVALIGTMLAQSVLPVAAPGRSAGLYWAAGIPAALLFLGCLLGHELAHSLVARRRGVGVRSITLWMLGGVSELEHDAPDARSDLAIAAAGPLTSFALGMLLGSLFVVMSDAGFSPMITQPVIWLAVMNVLLALFNMLPGSPLDGGRVLRALLWRHYGDLPRADLAAARAGQVLGRVVIALGVLQLAYSDLTGGLWTMLIGWFLLGSARSEGTARQARQSLDGLTVAEVMHRAPDQLQAWHSVDAAVRQTVLQSEQTVFPVVDFNGTPIGSVTTARLAAVRPEERDQVRIEGIMTPLPSQNIVPAGTPAAAILGIHAVGQLVAVVTDDGGRVAGFVTAADRGRIVQLGLLKQRTDR